MSMFIYRSLITLTLADNLISKFPAEALEELPSLAWFSLRGNYIETVPKAPLAPPPHLRSSPLSADYLEFYRRRMDKLDLGENFLTRPPEGAFNGSLAVNDLNLVSYNAENSLDL